MYGVNLFFLSPDNQSTQNKVPSVNLTRERAHIVKLKTRKITLQQFEEVDSFTFFSHLKYSLNKWYLFKFFLNILVTLVLKT